MDIEKKNKNEEGNNMRETGIHVNTKMEKKWGKIDLRIREQSLLHFARIMWRIKNIYKMPIDKHRHQSTLVITFVVYNLYNSINEKHQQQTTNMQLNTHTHQQQQFYNMKKKNWANEIKKKLLKNKINVKLAKIAMIFEWKWTENLLKF